MTQEGFSATRTGSLPGGTSTRGEPPTVRFRRGDDWQAGRLRSLTTTSIAVATACPPREGDIVEIELAMGGLQVRARAVVVGVTLPAAAAVIGAYGFGARFQDDRQVRQDLARLVATIDDSYMRPPKRRHPRYPVRWPVTIGIDDPSTFLPALDISERGLFIASGSDIRPGTPLGITIPTETGEILRAGVCVTRSVSEPAALSRKALPGFGVELTKMSQPDATRYDELVSRVARRSSQYIVICAECERLPRLTATLAAVGYAVAGTGSPRELVNWSGPVADLVMFDLAFDVEDKELEVIRRMMRRRGTPSVYLDSEPPSYARMLADAVLLD